MVTNLLNYCQKGCGLLRVAGVGQGEDMVIGKLEQGTLISFVHLVLQCLENAWHILGTQ